MRKQPIEPAVAEDKQDPQLQAADDKFGPLVSVYLLSKDRDCITKQLPDGSYAKYVYGELNGEKFEVQCDITTQVPEAIANIVKPQPKAHNDGAGVMTF